MPARLRRVVATSFQAVSGAGVSGIEDLRQQTLAWARGERHGGPRTSPIRSPSISSRTSTLGPNGYTGEEIEAHRRDAEDSRELPDLPMAPTTVRVPVFTCHSVAVNAETAEAISAAEARRLFERFPGLASGTIRREQRYPMPVVVEGQDDCYVGRIREDLSHPRA